MSMAAGAHPAQVATVQAHRLSADPPIFIGPTRWGCPLGPASPLAPALGKRRAHSFVFTDWTLEDDRKLVEIAAAYGRHADSYPDHHVVFLCTTEGDVAALADRAIPAIVCSVNLLVREAAFRVMAEQPKTFDAIYVAAMRRYKRHELAREISSLALIYYDAEAPAHRERVAEVHAMLPHAVFVNEELARRGEVRLAHPRAQAMASALLAARGHVNLPPEGVAAWCNRARVGLCLSAREGAMRASVEYLLCGLPVVSTESRGGRDEFFDSEFCAIVASDPSAVRRAVDDLASRAIAADEIRRRTLDKVERHRAMLADTLRSAFAREGIAARFDDAWRRFLAVDRFWRAASVAALLDPAATA